MNLSLRTGDRPGFPSCKIQVRGPLFADRIRVTAAEQIRRYYATQNHKNACDPQYVKELLLRHTARRSA